MLPRAPALSAPLAFVLVWPGITAPLHSQQLRVEPPGRGGAGTSNGHPITCPGTGKGMCQNSVIFRTGKTRDTLGWFLFYASPLQHWHQCILGICRHWWAPTGQDIQEADGMFSCGRVVAATVLECVQRHFPEMCPLLSLSARRTNVLLLQTSFGNRFLRKHLRCFPVI